ncbi:probable mitochondrial import inner membrane translocase subunit TI [Coccomyxa sp. Obi]|nr:probable mitochondrial import inner membrane translocase subunit TI [Coccomyxa sp. Obi]
MSRKDDKLQELVVTGREAAQEISEEKASISGLYEHESASQLPCILNGAMAGFSGGALGYVFGFGGKLIRHRGKGRFKACRTEGWNSAKSFAIFGGVYAFASCIAQRLRQKQDAINGGIAGCATGLALGWSGGPAAALQNAVMLGLFSYVVDYMQLQSAEAASRHSARMPARKVARRSEPRGMDAVSMLLTPSLPWLRPACDGCRACPLILPPALQQALPTIRRRLQD